jgi:hypothetical protein
MSGWDPILEKKTKEEIRYLEKNEENTSFFSKTSHSFVEVDL